MPPTILERNLAYAAGYTILHLWSGHYSLCNSTLGLMHLFNYIFRKDMVVSGNKNWIFKSNEFILRALGEAPGWNSKRKWANTFILDLVK